MGSFLKEDTGQLAADTNLNLAYLCTLALHEHPHADMEHTLTCDALSVRRTGLWWTLGLFFAPAGAPFPGFVINVNICTKAHRDVNDFLCCLVMAVGSLTKGELVLKEPGIVVPLHSGDLTIFSSITSPTSA